MPKRLSLGRVIISTAENVYYLKQCLGIVNEPVGRKPSVICVYLARWLLIWGHESVLPFDPNLRRPQNHGSLLTKNLTLDTSRPA